ncbi:MAG: hypothetical protein AB2L13_13475 [Spirochaetota bacterium]|jgi:apolipoprotein N-acyltransferase
MQTIDKLIVLTAILTISLAVYYMLYVFVGEDVIGALSVIIGIAGFLIGLFEFLRKSN